MFLTSEMKSLLADVELQCEEALEAAKSVESSDEGRRRVEALYRLRIRVLVNCLGLPLCAPSEVDKMRETEYELFTKAEKLREDLARNFPAWGSRGFSPFGEWVFNCSRARVADSRQNRNEAKRLVLAMTEEDKLLTLVTFPYDYRRLKVMREAALAGY
jgi:hypothetical protein